MKLHSVHRFRTPVALVAAGLVAAGLAAGSAAAGATVRSRHAGSSQPATLGTFQTSGNASTWVVWNRSRCRFVPTRKHPRRYLAVLRKQPKRLLLGYGTQNENSQFLNIMNLNIQNTAERAGFAFHMVNYQYPSEPDAIAAAESLALEHPAVVISYNVDTTIDGQLNSTFRCTPVIKISTPSTSVNTVEFGADNAAIGHAEGVWLAQYAKKHGWKASGTEAFGVVIPALAAINERVTDCFATLRKLMPGLQTSAEAITSSTTPLTESAAASWLTAHPSVQHVLGCSISDINGVGYNEALETAGRATGSAIVGVGVESIGLAAMGPGSAFKASVNIGYATAGRILVPMAEDILAGRPVPTEVFSLTRVYSRGS
ncbi:MAG TPA: substrate-binding domain-containing protein [Acidimicrobiales bacterium]|nr:substrate-binding domain-containing protein [Acidimicrobiales bacterium]